MSSEIQHYIAATEKAFNSQAPSTMNWKSEAGFAVQIIQSSDYLTKLALTQPQQFQRAVINVAAIGLSLNPAEKLAYLIPRKGKICLDPSYMGMCRLATNSGSIEWIQAELVYSTDAFTYKGMGNLPVHEFDPFKTVEDRGQFRGAYCVAKTSGGDYLTTMMSAEDILGIRDRSESWKKGQSGPWKTDPGEMSKKTVVRRAFKLWPRSDAHAMERLALAVELSNENEDIKLVTTAPVTERATPEEKVQYDHMITENDALGMFVFQATHSEGVRNDLYHSFAKGEKGKYQKIVDQLYQDGRNQFTDYVSLFGQALQDGDTLAIAENLDELPEGSIDLIAKELGADFASAVAEIQKEAAA